MAALLAAANIITPDGDADAGPAIKKRRHVTRHRNYCNKFFIAIFVFGIILITRIENGKILLLFWFYFLEVRFFK